MSKQILVACGAVALALVPLAASAHHGWGGQSDQVTEMTGTVVDTVRLAGPHATMKINADGHVWDITLAPPARTSSAGLKDGAIPVGQTVTVRGNRRSQWSNVLDHVTLDAQTVAMVASKIAAIAEEQHSRRSHA